MPVRNEAWCLGLTARAALKWCDELVILDHASNDATGENILLPLEEEFGRIISAFVIFSGDGVIGKRCATGRLCLRLPVGSAQLTSP